MSLLTPLESHAFQSFLASIDRSDHPDTLISNSHDWSMYSPMSSDDVPLPLPTTNGRDALTKATKDLMSLDSDKWKTGLTNQSTALGSGAVAAAAAPRTQFPLHQPFQYTPNQLSPEHPALGHSGTSGLNFNFPQPQASAFSPSSSNDLYGFSFPKSHPPASHPPSLPRLTSPVSISPQNTFGPPSSSSSSTPPPLSASNSSASSSKSSSTTPTPSTSYPPANLSSARHPSPPHRTSLNKRSSLEHDYPTKRHRPSPTVPTSSFQHTISSVQWQPGTHHPSSLLQQSHHPLNPSASATTAISASSRVALQSHQTPSLSLSTSKPIPRSTKATLLSPSQKKANHIQSEQKRRANIRRGYEALCDTVPSLREALREEEANSANSGEGDSKGRGGRPKRGKGKGKSEADGEKIDGRAGPRSENVVLSRTIDHLNDLLSERTVLMNRLARARGALPPGHAAAMPGPNCYVMASPPKPKRGVGDEDGKSVPAGPPVPTLIWEREWTGGEGRTGEDDEDEDDVMDD